MPGCEFSTPPSFFYEQWLILLLDPFYQFCLSIKLHFVIIQLHSLRIYADDLAFSLYKIHLKFCDEFTTTPKFYTCPISASISSTLGYAQNSVGTLRDASEIQFYHDVDDDQPMPAASKSTVMDLITWTNRRTMIRI
jgi:hypothetical protein